LKILPINNHTLLPEHKRELEVLHKEANEILSIIVASLKTARNKTNQKS
jgi:hypothetical protein